MGKYQHSFTETLGLFSLFFLFSILSSVSREVFPEKQILLEIKSSIADPSGLLSSWKADNSNYCSWFGVSCDSNSSVLELKIRVCGLILVISLHNLAGLITVYWNYALIIVQS